jgi:hypothetical protein
MKPEAHEMGRKPLTSENQFDQIVALIFFFNLYIGMDFGWFNFV